MTKIYISDKASQKTKDLLEKQFPNAKRINTRFTFANDDMFCIDETKSYTKEEEERLVKQLKETQLFDNLILHRHD